MVTVLIPTLNEEANVDLILNRIFLVKESCGIDFDILFVDSASSDNTCKKVSSWESQGSVFLLRREINLGLAGAVIAGARFVKSTYLLVMDADLSHPPEAIPHLLRPLLENSHDMVVGSRYVEGGTMPDWPVTRKLYSKLATFPALFFCNVKDPLAGFFALKRELIADFPVNVPGFKIGFAVLAECGTGLRILEVPIEFRDRDYGKSKMNKGVIYAYLRQLVSIAGRRISKRVLY
ncbi:MAG: polyprenol monophosphomannose synthase [Desulfobulbaceae bacterium]|nr:polyprenol monophosphomannose synthase [Desulfobulbaceae bacterium]